MNKIFEYFINLKIKMLNPLISSRISSIKIRKINHLNNIFSPPNNQSSEFIDLINSNQRFNKEDESSFYFPNKIKRSINNKKEIIKIKLNEKNNNNYRSKSVLHLPNISCTGKSLNQNNEFILTKNNNNNHLVKNKRNFVTIKQFENKNRELIINPVSLNLNSSSRFNPKLTKRKNINKDPFIKRVRNYKKRLKEELLVFKNQDFSNSNISVNRTQNYILDKDKDNSYNMNNNTNIYYAEHYNHDVNNKLRFVPKNIINCKYTFKNSRKFHFNDETKNNKYFS